MATTDSKMLAAALQYAQQGYKVFPCVPRGKRPLIEHGHKEATTDLNQIKQWWTKWPDANIGIVCGAVSGGLVVVDVDVHDADGRETMRQWAAKNNTCLPETVTVITGSGGFQYYFKSDKPIRRMIGVMPGVDILGDGYVVAPPSIHPNGNPYQWQLDLGLHEVPVAEADDAVFEIIEQGAAKSKRKASSNTAKILEGNRNSSLTSLGGSLQAHGASDEFVTGAIHNANVSACVPPLEPSEAQRIVESIINYTKGELTRDLTGAGLARSYAARYGDKVRYCSALGWLVHNGITWERSDLEALQLMDALAKDILVDANTQLKPLYDALAQAEIDEDKEAKKEAKDKLKQAKEYRAYALRCRSTSMMNGALNHAKCHLEVKLDQLDSDPYLLNTPDGSVDLKTGKLRPHDPKDFCTKVAAVSPTDSSDDKRLQDFLSLIFCGDTELIRFVQMVLGSGLIGKVYEEALVVAYGGGRNGKSTLFNTAATVLGSYSGRLPAVALTTKSKSVKHDLAELLGVRLCLAAETEEGMRLSNSMLKQIASTDRISAERKFFDPFDFEPSHLMVLFTNFLPKVSSNDYGTWRRIKVIPFNAEIQSPDTSFAEKLLHESGGALMRWLVEGAQAFIANGLSLPSCAAVDQAVEAYKDSNDWVKAFLNDCCKIGEGNSSAGAMYSAYQQWATASNDYPRSKADFKAALENAGFKHQKTNSGARWLGITIYITADQ